MAGHNGAEKPTRGYLGAIVRSAGFWIVAIILVVVLFILIFESPWPAIVEVMYGISG